MNTIKLNLNTMVNIYHYTAGNNMLLNKIASLLSTEIQESTFYKKLLYNKPYEYRGNADTITLADNYIVLGSQYEPAKYLLTHESFSNLMEQWKIAYKVFPHEITISIDQNKNFYIHYENQQKNPAINPSTNQQIMQDSKKYFSCNTSNSQDTMPYVEIKKNDDHLLIYPTADIRLNVLGNLLTSHIPWSNFLEQLHKKAYEYCDDTYFITIVEDKILIGDGDLGYNILPPLDKFLDLLHQWRLINSRKFKLIKLYIHDGYTFKLIEA